MATCNLTTTRTAAAAFAGMPRLQRAQFFFERSRTG